MRPHVIFISAAFLLAVSCSTTRDIAKEVERETVEKRKYSVLIKATGDGYTLHLRQNDFFDFQGRSATESSSNLYAGTWQRKGDSLFLGFHNHHKPNDLTDLGIIDERNGQIILFSKDVTRHRRLAIEK